MGKELSFVGIKTNDTHSICLINKCAHCHQLVISPTWLKQSFPEAEGNSRSYLGFFYKKHGVAQLGRDSPEKEVPVAVCIAQWKLNESPIKVSIFEKSDTIHGE